MTETTNAEHAEGLEKLDREISEITSEIESLEAEEQELEGQEAFSWEALRGPNAARKVEQRESRKRFLPKLLAAGQARRRELEAERYETLAREEEGQQEALVTKLEKKREELALLQTEVNALQNAHAQGFYNVNERRRRARLLRKEAAELRGADG